MNKLNYILIILVIAQFYFLRNFYLNENEAILKTQQTELIQDNERLTLRLSEKDSLISKSDRILDSITKKENTVIIATEYWYSKYHRLKGETTNKLIQDEKEILNIPSLSDSVKHSIITNWRINNRRKRRINSFK